MDEPLSNLDAKLRVEMRAYIARLHQELGTTTLYVTHDQTEAMTMGDRVAVMRDGRLEQVDTPQALYEHPANLFVAGFIGSPAMNLARARLERGDDGLDLVLGSQRLRLPGDLPDAVLARARRAGRGRHPARGVSPRTPRRATTTRCSRRTRRARRVARLGPAGPRRASTLRRCSPRTSSKSRARLAETRLPTSRALASRRAWRPTSAVAAGDVCACAWTWSACTSSTPTRRSP